MEFSNSNMLPFLVTAFLFFDPLGRPLFFGSGVASISDSPESPPLEDTASALLRTEVGEADALFLKETEVLLRGGDIDVLRLG